MQHTDPTDYELVGAVAAGDGSAFGALFDRWFDRVYDIAVRILHDDGLAAEVAQDVFLVAWQRIAELDDPDAFGGWVSRISRNRALNRLEHERRSTAVGDEEAMALIESGSISRAAPIEEDPTAALGASESEEMVWAASAALGERDASILHLHLRHGLGPAELAEELEVTPNNAHQVLFRLRKRLGGAIRAWVLWNHGEPVCPELAAVLDRASITSFGRQATRLIERHASDCPDCSERQALHLAPEALFSAAPIAVAAPWVRQQVSAGLVARGVPLDPASSTFDSGGEVTEGDRDHLDVAENTGSEPGEPADELAGTRRRRALAVAAVVVAVLIGLGAALLVGGGQDGEPVALRSDTVAPTSITSSPSTTSSTTTTVPSSTVADSTQPPVPVVPGPGEPGLRPPEPGPATPPAANPEVPPPPAAPDPVPPAPVPPAPPAPPVVERFAGRIISSVSPPGACATPSMPRAELTWTSTDASSASLAPQGGAAEPVATSGSAVRCSPPGTVWVLTVTGPGGTRSATVTP